MFMVWWFIVVCFMWVKFGISGVWCGFINMFFRFLCINVVLLW